MSKLAVKRTVDMQIIGDWVEPRSRVLDLGCGRGVLLDYLVQTKEVFGVGVDLEFEKVAACVHRGVTAYQGDMLEFMRAFPAGFFDRVICSRTLEELQDPTAIITGRRRPTTLASYGAKKLLNGKKPGVSVKVSRQGPRKVLKKAFLLTLKAGAEAGSAQGVFMRVGGKLKHLYGPSVDQLFRRIKDEISPQIVMDLSDAFFKQLDYELQRR